MKLMPSKWRLPIKSRSFWRIDSHRFNGSILCRDVNHLSTVQPLGHLLPITPPSNPVTTARRRRRDRESQVENKIKVLCPLDFFLLRFCCAVVFWPVSSQVVSKSDRVLSESACSIFTRDRASSSAHILPMSTRARSPPVKKWAQQRDHNRASDLYQRPQPDARRAEQI